MRDPNSTQPVVRGERQRPPIVVSRTHPDLLRRLFELEVPEVYDGVVEVRSIAREPGVRSKVAVSSNDPRLDPVGACVGPKGSRVRTVVSELRGERVDVVLWSDDPARRVASALSPARVSRVIIDEETDYATVIVPDDQLSLAIGKEGQNARLAARLTGMHIDIKNESLAAGVLRDLPRAAAEDDLLDDGEAHPLRVRRRQRRPVPQHGAPRLALLRHPRGDRRRRGQLRPRLAHLGHPQELADGRVPEGLEGRSHGKDART